MDQSDDFDATSNGLSPTRRWALVIVIGIVGCLAALPFRRARDQRLTDARSESIGESSRFARSDDTGPQAMADEALPPSVPFAGQTVQPEPLPEPVAPSPTARSTELPPAIPAAYEPLVQPRGAAPEFLTAESPTEAANILPQHLRELSRNQRWPVEQRQTTEESVRPRSYRIRDGDTLATIAQRYLGDYRRASEIFAMNRDRLARPDMLPLGESILLPPAVAEAGR